MDTQYVTTPDGVRIAYAVHGDGPPLLFVRGWISHIGLMWDDPPCRAYFEALGKQFRVVRFDMRGTGLSQRDVKRIDLRAMMADIEAVADTLDLQRMILYGQCFGGPAAIAYAAAHPERVARLILDGTYAQGQRVARPERQRQIIATLRDIPEAGLAFLTHLTHPNPGPNVFRAHERHAPAIEIETAIELYTLGFTFDVTDLLPKITVPTLVMHRTSTRAIPFRLGRELASSIRGSRFAPLEGQAHNPWEEYPEAAMAALEDFLGVSLELEQAEQSSPYLAFMVVELHAPNEEACRDTVGAVFEAHNGVAVTHSGPELMAYFASPAHAVECAIAVQKALAPAAGARIGLHACEPAWLSGQLADTAAAIARQAASASDAGEITVSGALRERCAGHGFVFVERGAVTDDRGEAVRLYEVRWRDGA